MYSVPAVTKGCHSVSAPMGDHYRELARHSDSAQRLAELHRAIRRPTIRWRRYFRFWVETYFDDAVPFRTAWPPWGNSDPKSRPLRHRGTPVTDRASPLRGLQLGWYRLAFVLCPARDLARDTGLRSSRRGEGLLRERRSLVVVAEGLRARAPHGSQSPLTRIGMRSRAGLRTNAGGARIGRGRAGPDQSSHEPGRC